MTDYSNTLHPTLKGTCESQPPQKGKKIINKCKIINNEKQSIEFCYQSAWWYVGASLSDMLLNLQHTQVAPEIKLFVYSFNFSLPYLFKSLSSWIKERHSITVKTAAFCSQIIHFVKPSYELIFTPLSIKRRKKKPLWFHYCNLPCSAADILHSG